MHSVERILKILSPLILIFINATQGITQEYNSARLTVLYGSNITFNFNSLEKIKNGIEIAGGTQLGISLADSNKIGHDLEGFDLNFRSFNGQLNIKGDVSTLPLNMIRVKAENALGLGSSDPVYGYQDLSAGWATLFSYTVDTLLTPWVDLNWANQQLDISYECGKPVLAGGNGYLLGEEPDYYYVEIELELVPTGSGF
jgi:hypothetical protein